MCRRCIWYFFNESFCGFFFNWVYIFRTVAYSLKALLLFCNRNVFKFKVAFLNHLNIPTTRVRNNDGKEYQEKMHILTNRTYDRDIIMSTENITIIYNVSSFLYYLLIEKNNRCQIIMWTSFVKHKNTSLRVRSA